MPGLQPFSIINRTVRGSKKLYVKFIGADGKQMNAISVTSLAHKLGYPKTIEVRKKKEGERVCTLALERGLIEQISDKQVFGEFIIDYWNYDGPRIQRKNKLRPNSIGKNYAYTMTICFTKHAMPLLPNGIALQDITATHLRKILNTITDEGILANSTIAKVMKSMTTPLREAYKKEIIHRDPTRTLDPIDESGKEKGILTPSEFSQLISWMRDNSSQHILLATVLAAATGMRKGEIRALKTDDIIIVNESDAIIRIDESYSDMDLFKPPKAKKTRQAPCPRKVAEALLYLAKNNPNGGSVVFWAVANGKPDLPVSPNYLTDGFYDALKAIGITEELRRVRNITFHSLRHYFITRAGFLMGGNMDTLRLTVGHESVAMTNHYTHSDYENLKSVAEASRKILGE